MADVAARLPGVAEGNWLLLGSLSLPSRVDPRWRWPGGYPSRPPVQPAQIMARPAFDLDLCHLERSDADRGTPDGYGERARAAVRAVAPPRDAAAMGEAGLPGLGGLVRYSSDLRLVADRQQVMGVVIAQPVGSDGVRHVDDPVAVEIDIKPRSKVAFSGEPARALQPFVGVDIPGFMPPSLPMYPAENLFADKASLLSGPPTSLRGPTVGPWHRYKDLVDLYFVTQAVALDGDRVKAALASNWNFRRMERPGVPEPYRVYGDHTRPGDRFARDEPAIDWERGIDQLREAAPQLAAYPSFTAMSSEVGGCVDELAGIADGSLWVPGLGWSESAAVPELNDQMSAVRAVGQVDETEPAPPAPSDGLSW